MGCAALHRPLRALFGQKSIDKTRGEGITAANTVKNLQTFPVNGCVKATAFVANGAPAVQGRGIRLSQARGHSLEATFLYRPLTHFLERFNLDFGTVFI